MTRRIVSFEVSTDLIREALAMPKETDIRNIVRHAYRPDVFVFYVEHPDFAEVENAVAPPEISPIIHADYEKRPSTWLTFDFGLDVAKENDN